MHIFREFSDANSKSYLIAKDQHIILEKIKICFKILKIQINQINDRNNNLDIEIWFKHILVAFASSNIFLVFF